MDGEVTCFATFPRSSDRPAAAEPVLHRPGTLVAPGPPPAWWSELQHREQNRPLVYVTLGSSGPAGVLQNVLDGLAGLPVDVLASTAGRTEPLRVPPNARVADLLPGTSPAPPLTW